MTRWADPPLRRGQLNLFERRLDDVVPPDHAVRALDEILGRINWAPWEAFYHGGDGRPPIHPRVLASVILYGLWCSVRSSRRLEESLLTRNDFLWLVEGRRIDHSTINAFRGTRSRELKGLFVDVVRVARDLGLSGFDHVGYDGTRVRANNHPRRSRTLEELRKEQAELERAYADWSAKAAADDAEDDERFGLGAAHRMPEELQENEARRRRLNEVFAELDRAREQGHKEPARLPSTDLDARIAPNKDAGFAANYTPTAMVDLATGLIVDADVLSEPNESSHMLSALDEARATLGRDPSAIVADKLMGTGPNLAGCEERGIPLYASLKDAPPTDNPAVRDDPTRPVPEADWPRLPTHKVDGKRQKYEQLDKAAFVYDEARDCYWCPQGKPLAFKHQTSEMNAGQRRVIARYHADSKDCRECPLKTLCLRGAATHRQLRRDQHDGLRERQHERMATPEAKTLSKRRSHPVERVFAVIKHVFGVRQFLHRGRERVRNEWRWSAIAFNLNRILSLVTARAGPGARLSLST